MAVGTSPLLVMRRKEKKARMRSEKLAFVGGKNVHAISTFRVNKNRSIVKCKRL